MYRYVDAIMSRRLAVLLPLILVTLLSATAGILVARNYEVSAKVWVESSPLLASPENLRGNQQPNELEATAFQEWLGTESFVEEIISTTGLQEPIAGGVWPGPSWLERQLNAVPAVGPQIRRLLFRRSTDPEVLLAQGVEKVRNSLSISWSGTHLVKVAHRGDDPELGVNLVSGAIDLFNQRRMEAKTEQARAAIQFYQSQLQQPEQRFTAAAEAVRRFKESHPLAQGETLSTANQAQLDDLEAEYASARNLYEAALSRLLQARLAGDASILKQQSAFSVVDAPEVPKVVDLDKKKLLGFTLVGLAVGLILGLGLVIVGAWMDRTVRSAEDLGLGSGASLLATIPHQAASGNGQSRASLRDLLAITISTDAS